MAFHLYLFPQSETIADYIIYNLIYDIYDTTLIIDCNRLPYNIKSYYSSGFEKIIALTLYICDCESIPCISTYTGNVVFYQINIS